VAHPDTIGDDLSAAVMPADLPPDIGHSNELAWKVHDLRQLYNFVYSHAPRLEGSDSLLLVFWRAFLGGNRDIAVKMSAGVCGKGAAAKPSSAQGP
jgi:hypothetical protein